MSAFVLACGVLLVSGAFKVVQPGGVAGAMRSLGMRVPDWIGRVLGGVEIGLGVGGLVFAGWIPAALIGAMYFGLALVAFGLLRRGGARSCGCFGEMASPPSRIHVAFDLGAAAVAFAHAGLGGWEGAVDFGSSQGWRAVPFVGLAIAGVACCIAILTVLPGLAAQVAAAREEADARHERTHRHDDAAPGLQIETPRSE